MTKATGLRQAARILLVEDDEDTRELMAMALEGEGFAVEPAGGAAEGLARLSSGVYDLVITDYDMPVKTGAAMLKEAAARGLLGSASTIVVTAHPEPEGAEQMEVIRKPIDLGAFLGEIAARLAPAAARRAAEPASGHRLEAILYVSSGSAASLRARRYVESLLAGAGTDRIRFEVCDIARDVQRAEADGVVYTPTLVRRSPDPPVWVVGDPSKSPLLPALFDLDEG